MDAAYLPVSLVSLYVYRSVSQLVCMPACLFACLPACLPVLLPVHLSVFGPICVFVRLIVFMFA